MVLHRLTLQASNHQPPELKVGNAKRGEPRFRNEPKTLKPGSLSQKYQVIGDAQAMNREW